MAENINGGSPPDPHGPEREPEREPDMPGATNPVGLDDSEFFAAEKVFAPINQALRQVVGMHNLVEVMRAQIVLAGWDAMLLDERGHGRDVLPGGVQEIAFGSHLAGELRTSRPAALGLLRDAVHLREGLPVTWAAFLTGAFPWPVAVMVSDQSYGLEGDSLARFDAEAAEKAAEVLPHRLLVALTRLRHRIDPAAAALRKKRATERRYVDAKPEADGQGALTLHGPDTDIASMYDAIRQAAQAAHGREGEHRPLGALMFDVAADLILHGSAEAAQPGRTEDLAPDPAFPTERLGDLRVPNRKAVKATLLVTVPAATATGRSVEPADLAGWGPLPADEAQRIVAHSTHWTRIAVDPIDDAVIGIDSSERYIPTGLRKLLMAIDPVCMGPNGCRLPAHRIDADHSIRFEHHGHTGEHNLCLLCRPDHRMKDDGYHRVQRDPDGTWIWRNRWGGVERRKPAMTVRRRTEVEETPAPF